MFAFRFHIVCCLYFQDNENYSCSFVANVTWIGFCLYRSTAKATISYKYDESSQAATGVDSDDSDSDSESILSDIGENNIVKHYRLYFGDRRLEFSLANKKFLFF